MQSLQVPLQVSMEIANKDGDIIGVNIFSNTEKDYLCGRCSSTEAGTESGM